MSNSGERTTTTPRRKASLKGKVDLFFGKKLLSEDFESSNSRPLSSRKVKPLSPSKGSSSALLSKHGMEWVEEHEIPLRGGNGGPSGGEVISEVPLSRGEQSPHLRTKTSANSYEVGSIFQEENRRSKSSSSGVPPLRVRRQEQSSSELDVNNYSETLSPHKQSSASMAALKGGSNSRVLNEFTRQATLDNPRDGKSELPPGSGSGKRFNSFQMVTEKLAMLGTGQESKIVGEYEFRRICLELPPRVRNSECFLMYSSASEKRHLKSFYRKSAKRRFLLILIKDRYGAIFGMFSSSPWRIQSGYYGSDDCLVFKITPEFQVCRPSGSNNLYQLSTSQYLAMGGGRDFALFLDSDFNQGRSSQCETFNSTTLSTHVDFDIVELEAWAFKAG
uniref:TLDc domain-containing protein n=1 Tax=Timspurckia oligopyrenoides TaxID=708627 RepID=A0A7S1EQK6_9RHOD|eukprot:CAMPEP_0182449512 /NCGR_PEP_ID=MMETSP1172-20130603/35031_1 /TAXON_ID=708627 /ORGANISM="Timspurckia oligopyrenoides, Strain CCMP3278" /LENGTH=389 /DNA_ID=CAMNT_0024646829 /DNA_START=42 /DNA_END=1211 /DNA_ORIENTATION=-